jgi:hypothetical protein
VLCDDILILAKLKPTSKSYKLSVSPPTRPHSSHGDLPARIEIFRLPEGRSPPFVTPPSLIVPHFLAPLLAPKGRWKMETSSLLGLKTSFGCKNQETRSSAVWRKQGFPEEGKGVN